MYEEFNKLKRKNPQMKTLLSLGGASAGVEKFRKLIGSDDDRYARLLSCISCKMLSLENSFFYYQLEKNLSKIQSKH